MIALLVNSHERRQNPWVLTEQRFRLILLCLKALVLALVQNSRHPFLSAHVYNTSRSGLYHAEFDVSAASRDEAERKAVADVTELLWLLSASDCPFQIRFGSSFSLARKEEPSEEATVSRTETEVVVTLPIAHLEVSGSLDAVKILNRDMQWERDAFNKRDNWPEWLKTALELRYLASLSRDPKAGVYDLYSALEVLADALDGKAKMLLADFTEENVRRAIRTFSDILKGIIPDHSKVERVTQQI
ncbi:MAG: hypothetical protein U0Z44_00095 [Kouleothrix sp.]